MVKHSHELIICIVNEGWTDAVMEAARGAGASGGTTISARGTANKDAEEFFHIAIKPEKEIVMMIVDVKIKEDVLHALYKNVGLSTAGQGIAFSMPVTNVVGLSEGAVNTKTE